MRLYLFVILVSLVALVSFFITSDLPHTQDGLVHLPRIAAYFKALSDGQIPPRWAGDLNYGYGMPLFNFIYQLPYFLSTLFLLVGFGLVNSFKLTLALSFVLSGVFMFAFAKAFFNDEQKALIVTLFYQFAPFRLVELLIRGSFGEVYAYAFLPLALYTLTMLFRKPQFLWFLTTTVAVALLILSHNSVSLMFFAILIGFVVFFAKKRQRLFLGIVALVVGLLLASFYWIPAVFEHKYTHGDLFMRNVYKEHFVPFYKLLLPNLLNSKSLLMGDVPVQIGLFHIGAIVFSVLTRRIMLFPMLLILVSLFFMQPISAFIWERVTLLRQFQFPWRFLSVVVFATAMLAVSYLNLPIFRKRAAYVLLLLLTISSTAFYWQPIFGYDRVLKESDYWNFPLTTTYYGETDTVWSAGPASGYPEKRVEVIGGKGRVRDLKKKSNQHIFTVDALSEVLVVDKTQYFPGWRVFIDGKQVLIQFQDPNWRGLMVFSVPEGVHQVRVVFQESKVRLFADTLTLASVLMLFLSGLQRVRRIYV